MLYLALAVRVLISGVLVTAVVAKLRDRQAFADLVAALARFGLASRPLATAGAAVLLAVETATAVLLWIPGPGLLGATLAVALFLVYAAGVGWSLLRRWNVACACFGRARERFGRRHLVRNLLLAATAALGLIAVAVDGGGAPHPVLAAAAVLIGAVGAMAVAVWDDLVVLILGTPRRGEGSLS